MRIVGIIVVVAAVLGGLALFTGMVSVNGNVKMTDKGTQTIQDVRGDVADVVRGK